MIDIKSFLEIINKTTEDINTDCISYDTKIKNIGLDSLDCYSVLLEIEERYGIHVSNENTGNFEDVNTFITHINKKIENNKEQV